MTEKNLIRQKEKSSKHNSKKRGGLSVCIISGKMKSATTFFVVAFDMQKTKEKPRAMAGQGSFAQLFNCFSASLDRFCKIFLQGFVFGDGIIFKEFFRKCNS